ncbi:MAG: hypothetical protein IPP84_00510 [Propionivibrio sp.]|uniref:hypothetical protein n=1 Tax=Propionivibrio sp. TaxID=2212460 RepID=UPI0025DD636E|nr:hypothetical protein [Propionivibrio sp.]MBL0206484.1 hypothetical protein [Propionivibrio sp.]
MDHGISPVPIPRLILSLPDVSNKYGSRCGNDDCIVPATNTGSAIIKHSMAVTTVSVALPANKTAVIWRHHAKHIGIVEVYNCGDKTL